MIMLIAGAVGAVVGAVGGVLAYRWRAAVDG